jgi:hypothetical protein
MISIISGSTSKQDLPGANTYSPTGNDTHQNALATSAEIKTLHMQQNSHIQSNTQTNPDLWNITVGYFKHRNLGSQSGVLHMIADTLVCTE